MNDNYTVIFIGIIIGIISCILVQYIITLLKDMRRDKIFVDMISRGLCSDCIYGQEVFHSGLDDSRQCRCPEYIKHRERLTGESYDESSMSRYVGYDTKYVRDTIYCKYTSCTPEYRDYIKTKESERAAQIRDMIDNWKWASRDKSNS